jgi:1,4-alpha-glucan branching enzyme
MKIIFLVRRFYPLIGGVEKHVFELSKRLISDGHTVSVITENSDDLPAFETIQPLGLDIYRISVGRENFVKKFRIWKELYKLRRLLSDSDIVHCHDVFFWYLPWRFLFPKKPVYTTFHGYESYPITKRAIRIRKLSERLSWGNICIGDFIKKWYGTQPTYVSYGAVESELKNRDLGFKGNKKSALFIGRLDDQTGILTYVEAFIKVKKKHPQFGMTVVGDGPYRKKISGKVNVLGFQKNPEQFFVTYRFAFVSRYLAILEAMSARRLVFAVYDNPVKKDYLTMAPYAKSIVIAENADKLSEKIQYYLDNPTEEQKLIDNAYKWVKKQTWEELANTYIKLWEK